MAEAAPKTILVVDDDPDVRKFLHFALVEAGFNVLTAKDGFEAVNMVKKHIPDLISLDLVMPNKSGIAFYRDMIKNKKWSRIPIIIVTGHARDEIGRADLRELTVSGPGIYLEKPVDPGAYVASVRQVLGLNDGQAE